MTPAAAQAACLSRAGVLLKNAAAGSKPRSGKIWIFWGLENKHGKNQCINLHSSPFFILQAHFFGQFYLNPSMILTGSWVDKPQRIDSQSHQNAPSLASFRINTVFILGIAEGEVVVYRILSGDHGKLKKIPFLGSI